ncbi:MAG TPA: glycosyltransferase family 2 protein [Chitinophagaceae bacterium]|jgi:glycosyltransferase involved in cell wall biosynthesis|nr:glycosyltransferase family 2 protein [Chitinophagaceae bacterium]
MTDLAIVIPAYKETYFARALESLANQSCKDFTVYIGDDHSPANLREIVENFSGRLDILYTRFDNNIGSENIVNQWKRCVELARGEDWIWLFSDDDIADKDCVTNFYNTRKIQQDRFDVYRFNTCVIDAHDKLTSCTPVGPQVETSEEMAYYLLMGERGNSMPDHIFRRKTYDLNGGFVFTRYAQAADWATSILFSREKGICIIPGAILYWRVSGQNISSLATKQKRAMMHGHLDFICWLLKHFKYLEGAKGKVSYQMIVEAAKRNLVSVLISHYKGFHVSAVPELFGVFNNTLHMSVRESLKSLLTVAINSNPSTLRLYNQVAGKK